MVKILSVKLLFRDLGKTEIPYCFVTYSFIRSRNPVVESVAAILAFYDRRKVQIYYLLKERIRDEVSKSGENRYKVT